MNTMALCVIVLNTLLHPVTLHGCTPDPGSTTLGCTDDPPITLTILPGTWEADDSDQVMESRTWDDPVGVTMRWRAGSCDA